MNFGIKKQNRILLGIPLILLVFFAYLYVNYTSATVPEPTPPVGVDTDGDGVADTQFSFTAFQAIKMTFLSGGEAWKYPSAPTALIPYSIADADSGKVVSQIETYIYFTVLSSKPVSQVKYVCAATVDLYDGNDNYVKTIASEILVSETVPNPENGTYTVVRSSGPISASAFQSQLVPAGVTIDAYFKYVIWMRAIGAETTFTDGTSVVFAATGVQAIENQLWWRIRVRQTGTVMQISNEGVSWKWT